jgi:hypothetical protein
MRTAAEILRAHSIDYVATRRGKFTTTCPNCNGGYLNVEEKQDSVVWYCPACQQGGGEKYQHEQRKSGKADGDRGPIKAIFDYHDEAAERLFQVLKFEPINAPKAFRQRTGPDQEKWSIKCVRRVLYRLNELIEDIARERVVFVVEGEKDVETLRKHGVPATTNPMGATTVEKQEKGSGWLDCYTETLRGADVVICGDNDAPGREHVRIVARKLHGVVGRLRILDLKQFWPEIEQSGDITDWFEAGATVERLWQIVEELPDYVPPGGNGHDEAASPWAGNDFGPQPSAQGAEQHRPEDYPSETKDGEHAIEPLECEPWARDPATIPPREFLYGRHFIRKNIGATIGAGGRFKTSHGLFEAIEMVVGRNLTTGEQHDPLRVLCLNAEEDQDELDRRVAAICQRYDISEEQLGGRLFVKSVRDRPLRLATPMRGVPTLNRPALEALAALIERKKADVFMLDPWVSFHAVNESSNMDMDLIIKQGLGSIASKTNSAGEIFHHPGKPKPGQAETTVEDARGASAILWAVRSARVFNFMTPDEASKLGIAEDHRRLHIRISNGKANMAPLGKAEWIKIEVENLPNGDEVAVSSRWNPPNPFDGVTTADMQTGAQLAATGEYRADSRSPEWFGYALADRLHIPVSYGTDNSPKDLARLNTIIKTWCKNQVLKIETRTDAKSRERKFIVAGSAVPHSKAATDDSTFTDDDLTLQ